MQVSLQGESACEPLAKVAEAKEAAEQDIVDLLSKTQASIGDKMQLTIALQQQKDSVVSCLRSAVQQFASVPRTSLTATSPPFITVKQHAEAQLQASKGLVAAFADTQKARDQLQQCLEKENALLVSLHADLPQALAQSVQLVHQVADALQQEDPQRELRHTQAMLRCLLMWKSCVLLAF